MLKNKLKTAFGNLRNSAFVKNVLLVMTGNAIAQAVGFSLSPVISRLFTPADFGIFGAFGSVTSIIAAGSTLSYAQAIMLPKEKGEAFNLFVSSCLAVIMATLLCSATCILFPAELGALLKSDSGGILVLLSFSTLVIGIKTSCGAWCVRVKAFKRTATAQVVRSASSNSSQIAFGVLKFGAPGLIISSVIADVCATLTVIRTALPDFKKYRSKIKLRALKRVAWEYRDFPMYSASQNVINALSNGLPVLLLARYFGIEVAGAYAFGLRLLWAPMSLFLGALRQVLFQKACESYNEGSRLLPLYVKVTGGLFGLASLPTLILLIWAPQIFELLFGAQWIVAGEYSRSLIVWVMFATCNLPAVLFARLIRIQRSVFIYDLCLLAARTLTLVMGGMYLNAINTIIAFSIVGAVMNFLLILLVGRSVRKKESEMTKEEIQDILSKG